MCHSSCGDPVQLTRRPPGDWFVSVLMGPRGTFRWGEKVNVLIDPTSGVRVLFATPDSCCQ